MGTNPDYLSGIGIVLIRNIGPTFVWPIYLPGHALYYLRLHNALELELFRWLAIFNQTINKLIERSSFVCRFAVEWHTVDAVNERLELFLSELFESMGRILAPTPILLVDYIAVKVVGKAVEQSRIEAELHVRLPVLHHCRSWFRNRKRVRVQRP